MRDKIAGWGAVASLAAAGGLMAAFVAVSSLPVDVARQLRRFKLVHDRQEATLAVVGALALVAAALGLVALKTFQGKYSCVGGVILFLVAAGLLLAKLA